MNEKHKQQKKELQSKIQALKKSVTKGDKKKKKEIDVEIELLEKNFEEKCKLDLENFENEKITKPQESIQPEELNSSSSDIMPEMSSKSSKAKKRKEKKEKCETERENLLNLQEIENKKGPAFLELTKINEKLKLKGLKMKDVVSDGNCMYYALADQLRKHSLSNKNCEQLREITCNYMLKNPDEFLPYLTNEEGDILDEKKYEEYCLKVRDTLAWGSQVELKALSDALNLMIEVVQGDGPDMVIGKTNEINKSRLVITFHRHMLSSCHFNSTEDDVKSPDDENY